MADSDERVVTPYEGTGHRSWEDGGDVEGQDIPAPLRLHETSVLPKWVDYNGHMSESCYLLVFGDDSDAFFRYIGIGERYRESGRSLYTVESHIHNRKDVTAGEPLRLDVRVLDHDPKRVHVFHEMWHGDSGDLVASAEQMLVHVDAAQGRACPLPDFLQDRLAAIRRSHARLPAPEVVGNPMGIPRKA